MPTITSTSYSSALDDSYEDVQYGDPYYDGSEYDERGYYDLSRNYNYSEYEGEEDHDHDIYREERGRKDSFHYINYEELDSRYTSYDDNEDDDYYYYDDSMEYDQFKGNHLDNFKNEQEIIGKGKQPLGDGRNLKRSLSESFCEEYEDDDERLEYPDEQSSKDKDIRRERRRYGKFQKHTHDYSPDSGDGYGYGGDYYRLYENAPHTDAYILEKRSMVKEIDEKEGPSIPQPNPSSSSLSMPPIPTTLPTPSVQKSNKESTELLEKDKTDDSDTISEEIIGPDLDAENERRGLRLGFLLSDDSDSECDSDIDSDIDEDGNDKENIKRKRSKTFSSHHPCHRHGHARRGGRHMGKVYEEMLNEYLAATIPSTIPSTTTTITTISTTTISSSSNPLQSHSILSPTHHDPSSSNEYQLENQFGKRRVSNDEEDDDDTYEDDDHILDTTTTMNERKKIRDNDDKDNDDNSHGDNDGNGIGSRSSNISSRSRPVKRIKKS